MGFRRHCHERLVNYSWLSLILILIFFFSRYGTYSVDLAINAGLDLEMPGPPRWRTKLLVTHMLSSQKVLTSTLDKRVGALLEFIQRQARRNPEVVYGDGKERTRDTQEGRGFCRRLAAEGMVVLRNEGAVLPLKSEEKKIKRVALIGPNMKGRIISGGGSAALKPSYVVTPYEGILSNAPLGLDFQYAVGCYGEVIAFLICGFMGAHIVLGLPFLAHKFMPTLENFLKTPSGQPGWTCTFYNHDAEDKPRTEPLAEFVLNDTRIRLNDFLPEGLTPTWTIILRGLLTMDKTTEYELGLAVAGRGRLFVDGKLTIDNWTKQRPGEFYYGCVLLDSKNNSGRSKSPFSHCRQGTVEEVGVVSLTAGRPVNVSVEYTNTRPPDGPEADRSQPALMRGLVCEVTTNISNIIDAPSFSV